MTKQPIQSLEELARRWTQDTQARTRRIVEHVEAVLGCEVQAFIDRGVPETEAWREVALAAYRWGARMRDEYVSRNRK